MNITQRKQYTKKYYNILATYPTIKHILLTTADTTKRR